MNRSLPIPDPARRPRRRPALLPRLRGPALAAAAALVLSASLQCRKKSAVDPAPGPDARYPTFRTEGRHLVDPYGEKTVLRGVNAMIIFWDKHGTVTYPEIAKTGANACRIFWTSDASATAADLDLTLAQCIRNHMIPVPSVWMATGVWSRLGECVDFWCRADVTAVLKRHERTLVLNIANEAGDGSQTDDQYRSGYEDAVSRLRAAGLRMPLMIDAAGWGRRESYILRNAAYLIERDPEHNLLFSWHPWDPRTWGGTRARIQAAVDSAVAQNIPFVIGEFSQSEQGDENWSRTPVEWRFIMEVAHRNEIGWLPWVWWCCQDPADHHSLTTDKMYGHWNNAPWGEEVAVSSPYSIRNTSVRPRSMQ
jgi:mannan endo-1,4-beta-mannosidase